MFNSLLAFSRRSGIAAVVLLASGFYLAPFAASSQQSPGQINSISGKVLDPIGAPVPGATATLTIPAAGQKTTAKTDDAGVYTFSNLPSGHATITISAQGFRSSGPINLSIEPGQTALKPVTLTVGSTQSVVAATAIAGGDEHGSSGGGAESYVTVSSNAVAGPMGYAATPSMAGATQSQSAQQQAFFAGQQFNYPSIIFYISAAPLVNLPSTSESKKIEAAQETDRNPLWLDASFTLSLYDSNGNQLSDACSDGSVQVLGLMPQATVAALKNQTIADAASAANDVAGALATFYPGTSGEVTAATKAMNIVFQDIFPPKPVAYEYSNMTDNCNFGWYFRPNTTSTAGASGQASILGIQTGIVLLKTAKSIASIKVNGRSLSAWNNPPTSDNDKKNKLFLVNDRPIGTISLPSTGNLDYDNITSLAMFPSLIPKAQAMKILHIDKDADFVAFATANKLVGINATFDYITNKSLGNFLGLSSPSASPTDGGHGPDPKTQDNTNSANSTNPAQPKQKGTPSTTEPSTPTTPNKQPSTKASNAAKKPVAPKS